MAAIREETHVASGTSSPRFTWAEFALRLALAVALLLAVDGLARARVPVADPSFEAAYRLPQDGSLGRLEPFIRHIRQVRAENPMDLIVVFLGASPAYGVGIKDSADTFPAAFESAAASDTLAGRSGARRVRAYNLAANGLLLGDQYVIAKAVGDAADLVVVQLTYQTFDPRRSGSRMREPDLASMLHVGVNAKESRALGVERRTDTPLDLAIDQVIRSRWFALGARNDVASAVGLSDASDRLYRLASGMEPTETPLVGGAPSAGDPTTPDSADVGDAAATEQQPQIDGAVDPTTPFDELDPAMQMVAISRASENSRFDLNAGNPELGMLGRLAGYLRSDSTRAAFFLAPMDEEILSAYEVLDEQQYERNVRRIRSVLARSGFGLIDYHREPFLTSADFVDLTHTTASGGVLTGQRLWKDLRSTVESTPVR